MLITTMLMMAAVGVFEGADFSVIVLRWGQTGWAYIAFALLGLAGVFYLCRYQSRRIDQYERERKNWRKGSVGECIVADILSALSDDYFVLNDLTTASGNLDHVVVGPTGVFAIETKNWRGLVASAGNGELKHNGQPTRKPEIKNLVRRMMAVREQVLTLTRQNDLFIKAVMIFPRARVEALFGTTSHAHCITDEQLCEYIENPKFTQNLAPTAIEQIARALIGIAGMDAEFSQTSTAAVNASKSQPALVAPFLLTGCSPEIELIASHLERSAKS
jgi:uncharacterized membrane protein YuzA (DUF378 family)